MVTGGEGYAARILGNLVEEARNSGLDGVQPWISLFVDERNVQAIKFYHWFGFDDFFEMRIEAITPGYQCVGMVFRL